jgi:hypothetical protein
LQDHLPEGRVFCLHIVRDPELKDISQLHHLPGTSTSVNERDIAMARQFFEGSSQGSNAGPSFATPHHLPNAEIVRMGEINSRAGLDFNEAWAKEQQSHKLAEDGAVHAAWAAEFGSGSQRSLPGPFAQHEMSVRPNCKPSFQDYLIHSSMLSQTNRVLPICPLEGCMALLCQ